MSESKHDTWRWGWWKHLPEVDCDAYEFSPESKDQGEEGLVLASCNYGSRITLCSGESDFEIISSRSTGHGGACSVEVADAHKNLIAASPALLAACNCLCDALEHHDKEPALVAMASAAIAKAESKA